MARIFRTTDTSNVEIEMVTSLVRQNQQNTSPPIQRAKKFLSTSRLPPIHNHDLLHCLRRMYSFGHIKPQYYDTIFEVTQQGEETLYVNVTRAILFVTCPYLAELLEKEGTSSGDNILHVTIRDVSAPVFAQIIEYCFTGDMSSEDTEELLDVGQYAAKINFEKARIKAEARLRFIKRMQGNSEVHLSPDNVIEQCSDHANTRDISKVKSLSTDNDHIQSKDNDTNNSVPISKRKNVMPISKRKTPTKRRSTSKDFSNATIKQEFKQTINTKQAEGTSTDASRGADHFIEFRVGEKVFCKYEDRLFLAKVRIMMTRNNMLSRSSTFERMMMARISARFIIMDIAVMMNG